MSPTTSISNPCLGRLVALGLPHGPLHLGHWAGAIKGWPHLQEQYESIFIIADLSLETPLPPAEIEAYTFDLLAGWLAAGLSPNQSLFVLQSAQPAHHQLLASLRRFDPNLNGYNRQIVDMLLYQAETVPVSEANLSLVEQAQKLARMLNAQPGPHHPEPRPLVYAESRLPGLDGRPMHRQSGNCIYLGDSEEETARKLAALRLSAPGTSVEHQPLAAYLRAFCADPADAVSLLENYDAGRLPPDHVCRNLADIVNQRLHSLRVKRAKWLAAADELAAILRLGAARARSIATTIVAQD